MGGRGYSVDQIMTVQGFLNCGWVSIENSFGGESDLYHDRWSKTYDAAKIAIENNQIEEGRILYLLSDVFSMYLDPADRKEPLKPMLVYGSISFASVKEFKAEEIDFLKGLVDKLGDCCSRARIADLLWEYGRPKDRRYAIKAVEAYLDIPLDRCTWYKGAWDAWYRAIVLIRCIGEGGKLSVVENRLIDLFDQSEIGDGYFRLRLVRLLMAGDIGAGFIDKVTSGLVDYAECFTKFEMSRGYLEGAKNWCRRMRGKYCGDKNFLDKRVCEIDCKISESYISEASLYAEMSPPNHTAAAVLYEHALQSYKGVPRKFRAEYGVDDLIQDVERKRKASSRLSSSEMVCVPASTVDLREVVDAAVRCVSGKSVNEAIVALALISRAATKDLFISDVKNQIQEPGIGLLLGVNYKDSDGRVIAKRLPLDVSGSEANCNRRLEEQMVIDAYKSFIDVSVRGQIAPAMQRIKEEHDYSAVDFVGMCKKSTLIPDDRATVFGKGLFFGWCGDFEVALHLIVPQIENMVRVQLSRKGVSTTTLGNDGIETENSLSALMESDKIVDIFGSSLSFEIKNLFSDQYGPNIRNRIAHGLLEENWFGSPQSVYAWWVGLRIALAGWCIPLDFGAKKDREDGSLEASQKQDGL